VEILDLDEASHKRAVRTVCGRRMRGTRVRAKAAFRTLHATAAAPYRKAGRFAYYFARGKLRADPVFGAILQYGLLQGYEHILDLGCGQGLLSAWLRAAQQCYECGTWPAGWPAPPQFLTVRGIELMPREVARARRALGEGCALTQGDVRSAAFGVADAVVILDVLHYIDAGAQQSVLQRVRAALPAGGRLLLRVGDASAGARFHITQGADRLTMFWRGHGLLATHCRSLDRWQELLSACGFQSKAMPMSRGTPFANVLLIAQAN
jgi:SAM-dependent methyltransferase